jgi:hypothetical protein
MILNPEKQATFDKAAEPLIKWLNDNCHPHVTVIVTSDSAELLEGVYFHKTDEYVKD